MQHEGANGMTMEGMITSRGSNRIPLMQHEGTTGMPMQGMIAAKDPMIHH